MTNEGRRDPRKPTVLQIRFKNATIAEFLEQHSRDVSRGGIFIKMQTPFPSGTLIKFDIRIAEHSMIHGVGRVVWCRQRDESNDAPAGMGVKFIKLDEKSKLLLDEVLAGKGPEEEAATPLFDDALPKPKAKISGISSRPPAIPKPSEKETGVSLNEDTRKVRLNSVDPEPMEEEAETVVSDSVSMEEVLRMARQSHPGENPSAAEALHSGTKEKFVEDISSAISDALHDQPKTAPKAPRQPTLSPKPPAVAKAPASSIHPVTDKRNNIGIIIGMGVAVVAAIVLFVILFRNPSDSTSPPSQASEANQAQQTAPPVAPLDEPKPPSASAAPENDPEQDTDPAVEIVKMRSQTVKIETYPKGAAVFINDIQQEGTTPMVLDKVPAEPEVELTIHRFGYLDYTQKLPEEKKEILIKQDLVPAGFKIKISSTPPQAKISIDNKGYGLTPRRLNPNHFDAQTTIQLAKPGYETMVQKIVEADWLFDGTQYELTVEATLQPAASPTPKPVHKAKSSVLYVTPPKALADKAPATESSTPVEKTKTPSDAPTESDSKPKEPASPTPKSLAPVPEEKSNAEMAPKTAETEAEPPKTESSKTETEKNAADKKTPESEKETQTQTPPKAPDKEPPTKAPKKVEPPDSPKKADDPSNKIDENPF